MFRVVLAMVFACASAALGQILVRRGMQQVGPLESWAPSELGAWIWHSMTNPQVVGGTALNALFYLLFLAVLSWAEVTIALPLTALEYLFAAALATWILEEKVPGLRWTGIALVIAGVVLISLSEKKPTPQSGKEIVHGQIPG